MSDYWTENISHTYKCDNCGGEVVSGDAAPTAKGFVKTYSCIRCASTGSVKSHSNSPPTLRGLVRIEGTDK